MTFRRAAAILPVRDITAAVGLYTKLGFSAHVWDGGFTEDGRPIYAILKRDGIDLHLSLSSNLDPHHNLSAVYLYVEDPDAVYREWSAVVSGSELERPEDRDWGVREMTYVDPDGNLLRIGRILQP